MHSSGMRTTCFLTVSQHALWPGGVPARGGHTSLGGVPSGGVSAGGDVPAHVIPLWTE